LTISERVKLIDKENNNISLGRQAELLGISRSSLYYQPKISDTDIRIMNLIDMIYTDNPTYGKRTIARIISRDYGIAVGKKHVRALMIKMGLTAIYPKPKKGLSNRDSQHKVYPYLLRNLVINRPNQVWSIDITYIRLEHGFCYLVAIIDWYSRYVIDWELSNTLDIDFCLRVLERAYEKALPDIFNSDQGSHFTSPKFTGISIDRGVKISMDGKGRCLDNIIIERLWRTVKQQDIYIRHYESVSECRTGLFKFFNTYNYYRPHQSLNYLTPAQVYFNQDKIILMGETNISNLTLNSKQIHLFNS
jgi:putative transposase